ncbi:MAG: cytochrome ubiquinol oxidase subunit I [Desulfurococcales archaeon]|nr:cytochrome ubiquinol oxidase subunit I [Desulfurococcales archaeon]
MASTLNPATFWLAFTFGAHIMMVNLSVGLPPLMVYYRNKGVRDPRFEYVARSMTRVYAAIYGLAGVFATAFTVFLLSFYPKFIGLAGHVALIPFSISIMMIALHFLMLALYWYGWDRWSLTAHNVIGTLLVISAFLIPFGFRAVFAFLNIPTGLHFDAAQGKFYLSVSEFLAHNPTFWPFYLKTIVGALTATFVVVAAGYAYRYTHSEGLVKEASGIVVRQMLGPALVGLVAMFFLGLWYALSLMNIPYKFNNIFGGFGWKVGDGVVTYNFSWAFALKMFFYLSQLVIVALAYKAVRRETEAIAPRAKYLLYAGFSALATIVTGEYLNAFSQYPWFIAAVTDKKVVASLLAEVPPQSRGEVASYLLQVLDLRNYNTIATLPGVTWLTAGFLAFLIAAAFYFVYVLLLKPGGSESSY